ncbi:conjugative transposon protein TraI [Bacteroides thetaiotaomicron CAG:40]|nr:conjugative transposon protein TraI [Bacteroides thetaiotaomicron CAG:40]
MLSDENYTPDELSAIAYGYTQLLQESSDVLEEMKSVVNINGLSMSDKERMDVIDRTYNAIRNYRDRGKHQRAFHVGQGTDGRYRPDV